MHSVSFGCWTPKLRVIVYDNFNQDVYKKWLCFIKRYDLKAKRARNVKVISMGWTKQDGIRMYRRFPFTLVLPYATLYWTGILTVIIGFILASAFSAILVYAQKRQESTDFIN
ncbi:hypothetical protein DXG04_20580 [Salmonella enterica subsp. enterica]|nr:hypothetical protein DXG04_20580 [Salmonella enterica subsp. enterica]